MLDMAMDTKHITGSKLSGHSNPIQKVQNPKTLLCKPKQQICNTIFLNQINDDRTGNTFKFTFLGSDDTVEAKCFSEIMKLRS